MTTSAESKWSGIFEKFYFLTPPSVSLRSPPTPQVGVGKKHGGEGRLTQNLASPRLSGAGDRVSTSNLASPCLQGEGDHQVVEGVAVGHYDKNQETFISFLFSDIIELTFSYKF